ncbi:hypothetical protein HZH66_013877 [Vespula vulgaris]|uniref:Uncharacterized protein n=1 Tax=Vespula vulgaris TaxID=7454 RepID=A0A834MSM6_VESVU|nr:hypothetical protein HZH66_013877 [Vespula vulgaris]
MVEHLFGKRKILGSNPGRGTLRPQYYLKMSCIFRTKKMPRSVLIPAEVAWRVRILTKSSYDRSLYNKQHLTTFSVPRLADVVHCH